MRIWTILSADTGKTFIVHIPNESTVEMMQAALAEVSGIPVARQVLINESGINVRRGMRLTSPRHESAIFVFDLKAITSSEFVRRGSIELPNLAEPAKPTSDSQHDDGEKAALLAKGLEARASEICDITNKNIAEQLIMARALLSARSNLVGHAAHFCKKFTAFNEELTNSFKQYDQILASCDTGFEALEKVTLPPELLSEGNLVASMSESTVVQNMQSIRSYVAGALQQLKGRFSELSVTNMETSARLEVHMDMTELEPGKGSHFTKLDEIVAEMANLQAEQRELCANPEQLATMYGNDAKLQKKMRKVLTAQEALQQEAHTRMRHISKHQSEIQKMAKSISGYKDSLQSLDRYFGELEHVPHIGSAFEAGLVEVRRRAQFRDAYAQQAKECTEKINELVAGEVGVRKAFAKTHGRHLPPMLIPGLAEMPPALNIQVPSFDTELPALEALEEAPGAGALPEEGGAPEDGAVEDGAASEGAVGEGAAGEGTVGECREEGAASEDTPESCAKELQRLHQTLETVRRERDALQQSMLEAHLKVSSQESQIKSMDEVRMNNTNLEVQLGDLKQTVSKLMESLETRNSTLAEVRQILGMATSTHSASGSSYSNETSASESQHDSALLELLKSQLATHKSVGSEVEKLEKENAELKAQLQYTKTELVSLDSDFQLDDLMCFLRRRPSQLVGCSESEVYEAISKQGESRWFLRPSAAELSKEEGERPRVVIGRLVARELLEAAPPEEGAEVSPFGLPEGSKYHCVELADVKTFT